MKLRTAIIDDEIHCIETLAYDLREDHADKIDILFTSRDSVEAVKQIKKERPDLVFLDIEMPRLSGFDVLELLEEVPMQVIFTTAHSEYAIKAVGSKAVAYLLKPVQSEDLEAAIAKVYAAFKPTQNPTLQQRLAVPSVTGIELIPHEEIIYCRSNDNYTEFFLYSGQVILASKTLKHFVELLPEDQFLRIHKSYVVNLSHVRKYLKTDGGVVLMENDITLPVSRLNKEKLLRLIQGGS